MMAHFPVAKKHLIEFGDNLPGDIACAEQQVGGVGAFQLAAEHAIERNRLQQLAERLRLHHAAPG
jgi:hypothetical protein